MYTIKEWKQKYDNGDFDNENVEIQIDAGWIDWFCKDNKLNEKTIDYSEIIKKIEDNKIFKINETMILFKEHLSFPGKSHDDIILIDKKTKRKCLILSINNHTEKVKYALYVNDNSFMKSIFKTNSFEKAIEWINNKK